MELIKVIAKIFLIALPFVIVIGLVTVGFGAVMAITNKLFDETIISSLLIGSIIIFIVFHFGQRSRKKNRK